MTGNIFINLIENNSLIETTKIITALASVGTISGSLSLILLQFIDPLQFSFDEIGYYKSCSVFLVSFIVGAILYCLPSPFRKE